MWANVRSVERSPLSLLGVVLAFLGVVLAFLEAHLTSPETVQPKQNSCNFKDENEYRRVGSHCKVDDHQN